MIPSVWIGSDAELIQRILRLHAPEANDVLDCTYGHGRFWATELWASAKSPYRVTGIDIGFGSSRLPLPDPASWPPGVISLARADYRELTYHPASFDAIICDPPFMARGGDGARMKALYSTVASYKEMITSLQRASAGFSKVLRPGGILIVKLMDLTEGKRRRFAHIDVANAWAPLFRLDDIFIKVAVQSLESPSWKRLRRSRAAHTYFMVFRPNNKPRPRHDHRQKALIP